MPIKGMAGLYSARPGSEDGGSLIALPGLLETGDTMRCNQHYPWGYSLLIAPVFSPGQCDCTDLGQAWLGYPRVPGHHSFSTLSNIPLDAALKTKPQSVWVTIV